MTENVILNRKKLFASLVIAISLILNANGADTSQASTCNLRELYFKLFGSVKIGEGGRNKVYRVNFNGKIAVARVRKNGLPIDEVELEGLRNLSRFGGPEIYGTAKFKGQDAIIMEEIEGARSIDKIHPGERVTEKECRQIEAIVENATREGFEITVDAYPENILLDAAGKLRLIDMPMYLRNHWESDPAVKERMRARGLTEEEIKTSDLEFLEKQKKRIAINNRMLYSRFIDKGGPECEFLDKYPRWRK